MLPSRWREQVERTRDVYGNLPDENILKGFRTAAGLRACREEVLAMEKSLKSGVYPNP